MSMSDPFRRNGLSESLEQYASRLGYPADAVHSRWRAWGIVFLTGLPFIEAVDCVAGLGKVNPVNGVALCRKLHLQSDALFEPIEDYDNEHQEGDVYSLSASHYEPFLLEAHLG